MSVQASTISSAWAPSRLVLPVKPYSVARNLVGEEKIKDEYPGFPELDFLEFLPCDSHRLGEHGAVVLDRGQLAPRKLRLHRSKLFSRQSLVGVAHLRARRD